MGQEAQARIQRALTNAFLLLLVTVILLGALFVLYYWSYQPEYGRFTRRFLPGVLLHFGVLPALLLAPTLAPEACRRSLSRTLGRLPSHLAALLGIAGLLGSLLYSFRFGVELADGGARTLAYWGDSRKRSEAMERMYQPFFDLLAAMDQTAKEAGASFMLVVYPQRYQVQPQDWDFLKHRWSPKDDDFDLS